MTGGSLSACPCAAVENRQLTLDLQAENKGSVVSGGELTIFLDGPAVALGSVPDGSAGPEGECPVSQGQHWPLPPGEAPAHPSPVGSLWPERVARAELECAQAHPSSLGGAALLQPSSSLPHGSAPSLAGSAPSLAASEGWGNGVTVC